MYTLLLECILFMMRLHGISQFINAASGHANTVENDETYLERGDKFHIK